MNLNMSGKRALVSGGLSTLGRAVVHTLATEGVEILFTYRSEGKAEEARDLCRSISQSYDVYCNAVCLDFLSASSVEAALSEVAAIFPSLDILIHNAGVFTLGRQNALTEKQWDEVMDVNIKGFWRLMKGVDPLLRSPHGAVVAVSSINAERPGFGLTAHYDASKGAVSAYVRSLAAELAPRNIRVNGVAPGLLYSETLVQENPSLVDTYVQRALTSSLVDVQSVSSMVVYLASTAASAITGEIVTIDGGYSLT